MNPMKAPNGVTSWIETHYEAVRAIETEMRKDKPSGIVAERYKQGGYPEVYTLSIELTNEFEELNKGRLWDGEFYDEVEEFMNQKLKP